MAKTYTNPEPCPPLTPFTTSWFNFQVLGDMYFFKEMLDYFLYTFLSSWRPMCSNISETMTRNVLKCLKAVPHPWLESMWRRTGPSACGSRWLRVFPWGCSLSTVLWEGSAGVDPALTLSRGWTRKKWEKVTNAVVSQNVITVLDFCILLLNPPGNVVHWRTHIWNMKQKSWGKNTGKINKEIKTERQLLLFLIN